MRVRGIVRVALVAMALAMTGGPGGAADAAIPLDDDFGLYSINWRSGGRTVLIFSVRKIGASTAVCGVVYSEGPVPGAVTSQALQAARVKSGNKTLKSNLAFFTKARPSDEPSAVRATCRVTSIPWQDAYARNATVSMNRSDFEY